MFFNETCPALRLGDRLDGFGFDGHEVRPQYLAHSASVGGLGRDEAAALKIQPFNPDLSNGE